MRPGIRVACDVGSVRIGLARSDALGLLAVPLPAVAAGPEATGAVCDVMSEWEAIEVYVGLPLHLNGREGPSAVLAREWAGDLAERCGIPVRLLDERLSTVQAQRGLHASGRSSRASRSRIDSASAVVVLQAALDQEHRTGLAGGEQVVVDPSEREVGGE